MTDLSAEFKALAKYRPTNKARFATAASLFGGHDCSRPVVASTSMCLAAVAARG